jgi:hypothetical protein
MTAARSNVLRIRKHARRIRRTGDANRTGGSDRSSDAKPRYLALAREMSMIIRVAR